MRQAAPEFAAVRVVTIAGRCVTMRERVASMSLSSTPGGVISTARAFSSFGQAHRLTVCLVYPHITTNALSLGTVFKGISQRYTKSMTKLVMPEELRAFFRAATARRRRSDRPCVVCGRLMADALL